jgi:hypothetical protein
MIDLPKTETRLEGAAFIRMGFKTLNCKKKLNFRV